MSLTNRVRLQTKILGTVRHQRVAYDAYSPTLDRVIPVDRAEAGSAGFGTMGMQAAKWAVVSGYAEPRQTQVPGPQGGYFIRQLILTEAGRRAFGC